VTAAAPVDVMAALATRERIRAEQREHHAAHTYTPANPFRGFRYDRATEDALAVAAVRANGRRNYARERRHVRECERNANLLRFADPAAAQRERDLAAQLGSMFALPVDPRWAEYNAREAELRERLAFHQQLRASVHAAHARRAQRAEAA
jgi:hypothetical protein